ncbi:Pyruvate decarboxylase [Cyphellophora attinorum]|uniref:Pyruvate decarboxylase n=1 Tax=Cyphellophora attinorum TaxID=1664694 RepID=A0A0N1HQV0_9EURO|nr:Pyruvate decarboxylase [Phialophora attinorum]KPI37987.1 Pyruvate decarboxylase [Phialophora attinorum]
MSVAGGVKTKIPLARYILNRLEQHGCTHLHGVPGDYSLPFLSHLPDSKVKWVGSCNELNAGYAADSYARITGLGALCTTYGVGELSALNAVCGSYAENVPVVHIVGMPSTTALKTTSKGRFDGLVHHALGRQDSLRAFTHAADVLIHASKDLTKDSTLDHTAAFDDMLHKALFSKRPVRIGLPSDLSELLVNPREEPLNTQFEHEDLGPWHATEFLARVKGVSRQLRAAKRPVIVVDGLASRFGQKDCINTLVAATGFPTVVTPHGLGIVESNHYNYCGVYTGPLGSTVLHEYVQNADCILIFGELFSDTNTVGWKAIPPTSDLSKIIHFNHHSIGQYFASQRPNPHSRIRRVDVTAFVEALATEFAGVAELDSSVDSLLDMFGDPAHKERPMFLKTPANEILPRSLPPLDVSADSTALTQDYVYPRISAWLQSHDTVILANGTPLIGAALLSLPPKTRVFASGLWFSVGQMLPAAQGAALALQTLPEEQRGRTILLEGDGGFQATAQELSTIIRYKLDGPTADYNDVNDWEYTFAPALMGGKNYIDASDNDYKIYTRKISTTRELDEVLADADFNSPQGVKLVELQMGELDVPSFFAPALEAAGKRLLGATPPLTSSSDARPVAWSDHLAFPNELHDSVPPRLGSKEQADKMRRNAEQDAESKTVQRVNKASTSSTPSIHTATAAVDESNRAQPRVISSRTKVPALRTGDHVVVSKESWVRINQELAQLREQIAVTVRATEEALVPSTLSTLPRMHKHYAARPSTPEVPERRKEALTPAFPEKRAEATNNDLLSKTLTLLKRERTEEATAEPSSPAASTPPNLENKEKANTGYNQELKEHRTQSRGSTPEGLDATEEGVEPRIKITRAMARGTPPLSSMWKTALVTRRLKFDRDEDTNK